MARKDTNVAYRDENSVTGLLAVSSVDGSPVQLWADPTTHRLLVDVSGGGVGGIGLVPLAAGGAVNGSNKSFTFSQKPTYIVLDGVMLTQTDNNGGVQWSWVGGTLTATIAVPPTNSIFGLANISSVGSVYTEILTDSGDHQNFTSLHTITNIFSIMDAYDGKGIPASDYSVSGTTLTLTSPDANLAADGIQLTYQ